VNYLSALEKLAAVTLILAFASSAQALDIDTLTGNGADAEIANDGELFGDPAANSDDPRGTERSMNVRFLPVFDPHNERYRAGLMRFDITGVSGDLSGGGISFQSPGSSRNVFVFALNDTAEAGLENWDESTVTFDTAPGIVNMGELVVDPNSGVVDPNHYTFLTEWRIQGEASDGADPNHEFVFTSYLEPNDPNLIEPGINYTRDPNTESNCMAATGCIDPNFGSMLANAVAADTNGLLTLLFFPKGDGQASGNVAIRTKEWSTINDPNGNPIPNPDFALAPTLHLPFATQVIQDADYNNDGLVDGLDFLEWQLGNSPDPLSQADLALWETQYGGPPPVAALAAAVPEPSSLMMLALASIGLISVRTSVVRRSNTLARMRLVPVRSRSLE